MRNLEDSGAHGYAHHCVLASKDKLLFLFFSFSLSSGLLILNDSQVFYAHERPRHPRRCPYEAQSSHGHNVAMARDADVAATSCIARPPPTSLP
jgi:hypothetical protein